MFAKLGYTSLFIASSMLMSIAAVNTNIQTPNTPPPVPALPLNIPIKSPGLEASAESLTPTQSEQSFDRLLSYIKRTGIVPPIVPATREDAEEKLEPVNDPIPLVALFMMKDEAQVFKQTLDPYVKAGIKHFLIYEGGKSSDNTVELAKQYFKDNNIQHGYVVKGTFGEWITNPDTLEKTFILNFATARSRALDAARAKFPNATFVLFPDAEWLLHNGEKLLDYCKTIANDVDTYVYAVRIMDSSIDFDTPRLIRLHTKPEPVKFKGRIHEVPLPTGTKPMLAPQLPRDVYFELTHTAFGSGKTHTRWESDIRALTIDHLENQKDSRPLFYLGQTYDGLGGDPKPCLDQAGQKFECFSPDANGYMSPCCKDLRDKAKLLEEAYKFYKMRAEMKAWDQEDFVAMHRTGNIVERLVEAEVPGYTWAQALAYYLEAYNMRPSRIDPLVQISEYYWKHNINTPERHLALTFLFARIAAEKPYPKGDLLFVPKWFYDFKRYEQLSKSAAYVGECPTGERATDILLQNYGNDSQLLKNKILYMQCKLHNDDLWGYNTTCPRQ